MSDTLKKTYLAGLGLAAITFEKAEKLAKDLVKKGEIAKEKQQEFVNSLVVKAKKNTADIEKIVKEKVEELAVKGQPLKKKQDELVKEISQKSRKLGDVSEKTIKKIIKDIIKKSKTTKEKIAKRVSFDDRIEEALTKFKVPTRKDIDEIKKKLDELISLQGTKKNNNPV